MIADSLPRVRVISTDPQEGAASVIYKKVKKIPRS